MGCSYRTCYPAKAITVREAVSVPPGTDEPEGENPGMDRQMKTF